MIAISDPEGRLVYVNPAHTQLFGRSLKESQNLSYLDWYSPESLQIIEQEIDPLLAEGRSLEVEIDMLDVYGRRFPVWGRVDSIRDPNGNMRFVFGAIHEISAQKKAEDKRLQAARQQERVEKAKSLCRMAGAVAHHFNNILSVVLGNLDLAIQEMP